MQVRLSAIAALTQLNMNIDIAARGGQAIPRQIDRRGRSQLQSVLLKALNDSDFRIRGGAAKAIVFVTYPPSANVRIALIAAFQRERDPGVRTAIVSEIGKFTDPDSADQLVCWRASHRTRTIRPRIDVHSSARTFTPAWTLKPDTN